MRLAALALALVCGCSAINAQEVADRNGDKCYFMSAHNTWSAGAQMDCFDKRGKLLAATPGSASSPADWFGSGGNTAIIGGFMSSGFVKGAL